MTSSDLAEQERDQDERAQPRQVYRSANRLRRRYFKRWRPLIAKQFAGMLAGSVSDARACAGQSSATYARNELRRFAGIVEAVVLLALWMRGERSYRAHESVNDLATKLEWERKAKERSR
jgi:hypothetical protein